MGLFLIKYLKLIDFLIFIFTEFKKKIKTKKEKINASFTMTTFNENFSFLQGLFKRPNFQK